MMAGGPAAGMVAGGRLYRRETLDHALHASQRRYRGRLYDRVSMAIGTKRRNQALESSRGE